MTDPGLSSLLKWSVENSSTSQDGSNTTTTSTSTAAPPDSAHGLPAHALAALLGGPSDADLMREAMAAITSPSVSLQDKLIAFDNFEQLVESIDNANNLGPLGLWEPLAGRLRDSEGDLRLMAAWCVGTAAQNNVAAQERVSLFNL
jgi:hsp70-interacting protein